MVERAEHRVAVEKFAVFEGVVVEQAQQFDVWADGRVQMENGGGAARVGADDYEAARGMRQEAADALEQMERPSRADQEIEQQQHEHHGRRARDDDRQDVRCELDGESGERRGQGEAQAFGESGVAPDAAVNAGEQERSASNCDDPWQAREHLRDLRDTEIEIEAQQHRAEVRGGDQRGVEDQLDEAALVAEAQDDAGNRGQVLDSAGRLSVERSIHQEQRDQREEQRDERNQQHRVVARHEAERDRAGAGDDLQADQRRRRAVARHAKTREPMMRMVEAAARDGIAGGQAGDGHRHRVEYRDHQRQQRHREPRRQRSLADATRLNR